MRYPFHPVHKNKYAPASQTISQKRRCGFISGVQLPVVYWMVFEVLLVEGVRLFWRGLCLICLLACGLSKVNVN